MAGGYSRSPVPRSLTSALERLMVSSESMMKWTRSSCSTHSCKLGGRSMGVSRSMFTNRVATYSQRTGGLIYSPKVRQAPGEPRSVASRITRKKAFTSARIAALTLCTKDQERPYEDRESFIAVFGLPIRHLDLVRCACSTSAERSFGIGRLLQNQFGDDSSLRGTTSQSGFR